MKMEKLTPAEEDVIVRKATERPFSGEYDSHFRPGVYTCRRCRLPLFSSGSKFDSGCGWPSFDDAIAGAVIGSPDPDGERVEIACARCHAHLGHVFKNEGFTPKNTRHCVNSLSMRFVAAEKKEDLIVLGGGCFWCTEAVFKRAYGVTSVRPGYAGGKTENPSYAEVCTGRTGHAETLEIAFDATKTTLERILEIFFASHDPTSKDKQGNDVGAQYRSIILCTSERQLELVRSFIDRIADGYQKPIVTEVSALERFYPAEQEHVDYFKKHPYAAYCALVIAPKLKKIEEKGLI